MVKPLPFKLNRDHAQTLSLQIAEGVQRAVWSGYYREGDRLPNLDEMASSLQVARQTVRTAVSDLVQGGLVVARPKRGIEVLSPDSHIFTAHVIHLTRGGMSYYFSARNQTIIDACHSQRVQLSVVDLTDEEFERDHPHTRAVLDGNAIDLALIDGPADGIRNLLRDRSIPYVALSDLPDAQAAWHFGADYETALREFARHAQQADIKTIRVCVNQVMPKVFKSMLGQHGITVQSTIVEVPREATSEIVERCGYDATTRLIQAYGDQRKAMLFTDDYLARGGLTALLASGIRVPEQWRVASFVNCGHQPIFPVELTRIEVDPIADGRSIAGQAIAMLRNNTLRSGNSMVSRTFRAGATL